MTGPTDVPEQIELPWGRLADRWRMLRYYRLPRVSSRLRRFWAVRSNPHATVRFGHGCIVGPGFRLMLPAGGTFIVGDNVEFRSGFRCELSLPTTRVEIGAGSVFTRDVLIQCSTELTIGERCMFGQTSIIVDGNHRFRDLSRPMLDQGYDYRPIRIEDDVTVLTKCTIVADIATRSVVGANSVVVRDIPPYTVVAGVPAKVRDYFGPPGLEPEGWTPRELSQDSPAGIEGMPVRPFTSHGSMAPHRHFLIAAVRVRPAPEEGPRLHIPPTP